MNVRPRPDNDYFGALKAQRGAIVGRYRELTPVSRGLYEKAGATFPGGFSRDAIYRPPYSPFVVSAKGTTMHDADGRSIIDMWFNATSLPLGHAHPAVIEAAERQLRRGTAYFAPTEQELALGELLIERIPCAERIRFTNSGSEAVMMALRFARAHRNRPIVVKFEGSYHGSYDDVSWSVTPPRTKAGAGPRPAAIADTAGLVSAGGRIVVLPFNDVAALRSFVEEAHADIAAILVEPVANRMGLILPEHDFVAEARALCDRFGPVLIFDEVIAFRAGHSGAQGRLGITPDLTTLGKIIGGGFPVGAVAGRADILDLSGPDREGRVSHAGTFNGNPMVGAAGRATMELLTPELFDEIGRRGERVRARLRAICDGLPLQVTGLGSLYKVTATRQPIRCYVDAVTADFEWERLLSLALLCDGFMLTPGLSGCVSAVTTDAELDQFLDAFERLVRE